MNLRTIFRTNKMVKKVSFLEEFEKANHFQFLKFFQIWWTFLLDSFNLLRRFSSCKFFFASLHFSTAPSKFSRFRSVSQVGNYKGIRTEWRFHWNRFKPPGSSNFFSLILFRRLNVKVTSFELIETGSSLLSPLNALQSLQSKTPHCDRSNVKF